MAEKSVAVDAKSILRVFTTEFIQENCLPSSGWHLNKCFFSMTVTRLKGGLSWAQCWGIYGHFIGPVINNATHKCPLHGQGLSWAEPPLSIELTWLTQQREDSSKGMLPLEGNKGDARERMLPGTEGALHVDVFQDRWLGRDLHLGGKARQNKQKRQRWASSYVLLFLLNERRCGWKSPLANGDTHRGGTWGISTCSRRDGTCFPADRTMLEQGR